MKIPKRAYTTELKELAVKRIKDMQIIGKVVTHNEMELSRLRTENLRLTRKLEIKKRRRRATQRMFSHPLADEISKESPN